MDKSTSDKGTHAGLAPFVYLVASIGALGGLLFGFDTGVISGALIFINRTFAPSIFTQEVIVSSVVFGAFIGAISSGRLADGFGRRRSLIAAAVTFILGTLIATFAVDVYWLVFGRFVLGLAIGVASFVTPLFISEIAPARYRGALVLFNAIAITGGETIAYLVDYALVPTESWRLMFAVGLIPAILLLIGMLLMPDSPRWVVLRGFPDEARRILCKIRRSREVSGELEGIRRSVFLQKGTLRDVFTKKLRPVLIIGLGLGILQQLVGINTVMYYGPIIFKHVGFHAAGAAILATFGMGLVNTITSIIAVLIVDRVGRRRLLLFGTAFAAISLGVVGLSFVMGPEHAFARWSACIAMVAYIFGYSIGLGSMFWLIISEIYPLNVRGMAMSITAGVQWAANFIVAITFLTILDTVGSAETFWLYGLMSVVSFIFCYYLVPETTGVSLEHIERNLAAGKRTHELGLPQEAPLSMITKRKE